MPKPVPSPRIRNFIQGGRGPNIGGRSSSLGRGTVIPRRPLRLAPRVKPNLSPQLAKGKPPQNAAKLGGPVRRTNFVVPKLTTAQRTNMSSRLSGLRGRLMASTAGSAAGAAGGGGKRPPSGGSGNGGDKGSGNGGGPDPPKRFNGHSVDSLSEASKAKDPADRSGQLTVAGRALQKHGGRPGSSFPAPKGNPAAINEAGQRTVDEILNNPNTKATQKQAGRYGTVTDVVAPDGRGLRYSSTGQLIGFLEP